jgi:hypothetical protein
MMRRQRRVTLDGGVAGLIRARLLAPRPQTKSTLPGSDDRITTV